MSLFGKPPVQSPLAEIDSAVLERQRFLAGHEINNGNSAVDPEVLRLLAWSQVRQELSELALVAEIEGVYDQI